MRWIYKNTVIIVYPRSNHISTAVWAADKMNFVKKSSGIKKHKKKKKTASDRSALWSPWNVMTTNHKTTFETMSSSHHVTSFCCIQSTTSRTIIIQWATLSCSKDKLVIYPLQRARVPSFGAICATSPGEAHPVFYISEKIALRMCVQAVRCQEE